MFFFAIFQLICHPIWPYHFPLPSLTFRSIAWCFLQFTAVFTTQIEIVIHSLNLSSWARPRQHTTHNAKLPTHHPQCHAHWLLRVCMCAAHLLVLLFASIFMLGYTNAVETISLISFPVLTCFFCLFFLFAANPQFSIFFFFALVCQSNGKKQNPRKKSIPNFASIPTSTPYIHMYIHPPRTHTKLVCERNEAEIRWMAYAGENKLNLNSDPPGDCDPSDIRTCNANLHHNF